MGQDVDFGRFRPAIDDRDPHQHVVGGRLGILDGDVETAVLRQHAGIGELVFGPVATLAAAVLGHEVGVGKRRLRIPVEHPHV